METPRCDRCRHWSLEEGRSYQILDLGLCVRAVPFWEVSEWNDDDVVEGRAEELVRKLSPGHEDQMLFVQDGSDYKAFMLTKPEFYCAHFDPETGAK